MSIADAGPSPEYSRPLKPPARRPPAHPPRIRGRRSGLGASRSDECAMRDTRPCGGGQGLAPAVCCSSSFWRSAANSPASCVRAWISDAALPPATHHPHRTAAMLQPHTPSSGRRRHDGGRLGGRETGRTVARTLAGVVPVLATHSAVDPGRALTRHVPPLPTAVCTRDPRQPPGRYEHGRRALRRATCDGSSTPPGHALVANLCPLLLAHAIACRLVVVQVPCSRAWGISAFADGCACSCSMAARLPPPQAERVRRSLETAGRGVWRPACRRSGGGAGGGSGGPSTYVPHIFSVWPRKPHLLHVMGCLHWAARWPVRPHLWHPPSKADISLELLDW